MPFSGPHFPLAANIRYVIFWGASCLSRPTGQGFEPELAWGIGKVQKRVTCVHQPARLCLPNLRYRVWTSIPLDP